MPDFMDELNSLSSPDESDGEFSDLWKSDNAATADEEQALKESSAPGIVPPSIPNFGRIAPPEIVPTGIPTGILGKTKIPKPETQAGIIPVEPGSMKFTNIQPETFVGAPPATGNVAENIKFEPAIIPEIQPSVPIRNLESNLPPPVIKPMVEQDDIGDQLNKIRMTGIFLEGETKDTQGMLSQVWSPSFEEKHPVEGPAPFDVRDPTTWVKKNKSVSQIQAEATREIPVQRSWLQEKLVQPLYGAYQIAQGAAGLTAMVGEVTKSDQLRDIGVEWAKAMGPAMQDLAPSIQDIREVTNVWKGIDLASNFFLQQLPIMLATMGTSAVFSKAILKGLEMGPGKIIADNIARRAADAAIKQGLTNRGVMEAAGIAVNRLALTAGTTAGSILAETGVITGERAVNGQKILSLNLLHAIPAGLLDSFTNWKIMERLNFMGTKVATDAIENGLDSARKTFESGIWKAIKGFGQGVKTEAIPEGLQEILEQFGTGDYTLNKDLLWRAVNSAIAGGVTGGIMSSAAAVLEKPKYITTDPVTGRDQNAKLALPMHAQFILAWDNFRSQFEPDILKPVPMTQTLSTEGSRTGEVQLGAEWGKTFQGMQDILTGKIVVSEPTILTEQRGKQAWADTILNAQIKEPGDITKLPSDIQKEWSKFWDEFPSKLSEEKLAQSTTGITPEVKTSWDNFLNDYYTVRESKILPEGFPNDISSLWNKFVMGVSDPAWARNHFGNFTDVLYFSERAGSLKNSMNELYTFWNDGEIRDGRWVLKDQFGGELENAFDNKHGDGKEFLPVKYTDPNGKAYIGDEIFSSQPLIDSIQYWLSIRERALGDTTRAETPPRLLPGRPGSELIPGLLVQERQSFAGNRMTSKMGTNDAMLVATKDGKDAGYLWGEKLESGFRVHRIEVLPEYQRQGIATELIRQGEMQWGPSLGAVTTQTSEGKAFTEGRKRGGEELNKPWLQHNFSNIAIETGKVMTRAEALDAWHQYETLPRADTLEDAYKKQYLREQVEAHLGSEKAMSPEAIRKVLGVKPDFGPGGISARRGTVPAPELDLPTAQQVKNSAAAGYTVTKPTLTYREAEGRGGNIWIRQDTTPDNKGRTLLVQFSTNLINPVESGVKSKDKAYYSKLYSGVRKGFTHPTDFWELPQWIGVASNSLPNADVYVIRSTDEAINFLKESRYDKVAFSALEVNKDMIKQIARGYDGDLVVGGYVDLTKEFGGFKNIQRFDNMLPFVNSLGYQFQPGTNYRHFQETSVVPRLSLSEGCQFKCSFCDVTPHGKVNNVSATNITRQVESIKKLKPGLVYINDKTFGQASNYLELRDIFNELKINDPNFQGFVIQTTAGQFNQLTNEFLKNSGIKYVEIGVESYNDVILKKYKKPHTEAQINDSFKKIRENKLLAIPNIIVGIKEETSETYQNTLNFIRQNRDIISHLNIYNLAVYPGTELQSTIGPIDVSTDMNENEAKKSWMKDPQVHLDFANEVFDFALRQLNIKEDQLSKLQSPMSARAERIPGFLPSTIAVTSNGVNVYTMGETYGQNLTPAVQDQLIDAVKGWHDINTDTFLTDEMYARKRAGEAVEGIPRVTIESVSLEEFRRFWKQFEADPRARRGSPFDRLKNIIGDNVRGTDPTTGITMEGILSEVDVRAGTMTIGDPATGKMSKFPIGGVQLIQDKGDFVLSPLQPPGTKEVTGKAEITISPEQKEYEHFFRQEEEVSGRVNINAGKGRGVWQVNFADGHKEFIDTNSKQDALKQGKVSYTQSSPINAELIRKEPGNPQARIGRDGRPMRMSALQVNRIVNNFELKIPAGVVFFKIMDSFDQLNPDEKNRIIQAGLSRNDKAFFDPTGKNGATILLLAENHADEADVRRSIFHELVGHLGFERFFGPTRMNWVTGEVHKIYSPEQMGDIYTVYGLDPTTENGRYIAAIEKIAQISETNENPGLWRRFVAWFKEQLFDVFGEKYTPKLTDGDIRAYLWRSRNIVQSDFFQSEMKKYNAMVQLMKSNLWEHGLPVGPLNIGARADTNFSHVDVGENASGWKAFCEAHKERNANFGKPLVNDLGIVEAFGSLPHWIAMKYPGFKPITGVEWDRQDKRNRDRLYLLKSSTTENADSEYLTLKVTDNVDKLIIWSDQNDYYLKNNDELQAQAKSLIEKSLTAEEIRGYHEWKASFDRAADFAIQKLRSIALNLYNDRPWASQFDEVFKNGANAQQMATTLDEKLQKEFLSAVRLTQNRMQSISDREVSLKAMNFYAPHIRGKGEFVVKVYDTDINGALDENGNPPKVTVWAERYSNKTDAELARLKLVKAFEGLEVLKYKDTGIGEFIYGGLSVPTMEAFLEKATDKAVQEGKIESDAGEQLLQSVFKSIDELIMARGFRQHYIQRHRPNIIGGYQTVGMKQVMMDYMSGLAGSMAKLEATYDFHKTLQNMDKLNQADLYQYAVRYVNDMLRNSDSLDRKLNAVKTIPYAWYLTMNLRMAATQGFQNLITAYPILARLQQENGIKGPAWARLGKAMVDVASGSLNPTETLMLKEAYEEGETMANAIKAMKGDIESGWGKKYFQKVVDVASLPFAGMEKFNRKTSLLAAFRMYTESGKTYADAYQGAKEFVRHAHYAYGLSNYPQLLRDGTPFSKVAGMAYVFKSFPHNYVLSMLHFAKDAQGKLALGVVMRSVAMLALLGGLAAVPFMDDLLEEYEKLTGHFVRSEVRNTLKKYGGSMLADVGMEGIPALVGIDMSGSTKMNLPIIPGVGQFDPNTFTMGVWGGLIDKGKRTLEAVADGEWARAFEAGAPIGVEMMMKAIRLRKMGLRTAQERPILDERGQPIRTTAYQTGIQVAGFRPEGIAVVQKERRTAQLVQEHYSKVRQAIRKDLRIASGEGDIKKLGKIREQIQKYNMEVMKYKGVIPRFSGIQETFRPEMGYMKTERALFSGEETD